MSASITINPATIATDILGFTTKFNAIVAAAGPLLALVELAVPGVGGEMKVATAAITIIQTDGPAIVAALTKLAGDVQAVLGAPAA